MWRVHVTIAPVQKARSMTYSEGVSVVLDIQYEMSMRRITLHLWPVCFYHIFTNYLINGMIFEWGGGMCKTKNVGFEFVCKFLSEPFLSLRITPRHIIINVHLSSCKVPVILDRL